MKEFNEIDELYGSAFKDFEVTPPADIKSAIDRELFPQGDPNGGRRGGFWYFGVGIIMLVTFLSVNVKIRFEDKLLKAGQDNVFEKNSTYVSDNQEGNAVKIHDKNGVSDREIKSSPQDRLVASSPQKNNGRSLNSGIGSDSEDDVLRSKGIQMDRSAYSNKGEGQEPQGNGSNTGFIPKLPELVGDDSSDIKSDELNTETETVISEEVSSSGENSQEDRGQVEAEMSASLEDGPEDNGLPVNETKKTMGSWFQGYAGMTYGFNSTLSSTNGLNVSRGSMPWSAGIEYTYGFNERLGLTSGIGFSQKEEHISSVTVVQDSTFIGFVTDSVWNENTQQYDSITIAMFDYFNNETTQGNSFRFSSVELPIFATWMLNKESRYDISVAAGVSLSYNTMKALDGTQLTELVQVNTIGMKVMLRPQFIYYVGRFGFGAYVKYSSELVPIMEYTGMKRNLQEIGGGFLFRIAL